jgi:hypothetical protein
MSTRPIGLTMAVALALAACRNGGGGEQRGPVCDGVPEPGAPGPGDAERWLPIFAPGLGWNYRIAGQLVTRPADVRIEVGSPRSFRGFAAVELREVDPVTGADLAGGSALVASTGAGLVALGTGDPADPTPAAYDLRFPVTVGDAWNTGCSGLDFGEDLDGDGTSERLDLQVDGQVLGLEDVTTPAGSFTGTAHVRLLVAATLHPTDPDYVPVTLTGWQESWYARGVGIVRRSSGGDAFVAETYELIGWSGGGLASLTRLVVPPPSSDPWVTPWRVIPVRGDAQRALLLELARESSGPVRLVGRFVDGGVATAPFDVIPQWPGDALLPWPLVHQVAPGLDQHLIAFAVPQPLGAMEIRAARVSAAGVALDAPAGRVVAQCARYATHAVAASRLGSGFLVAWSCDDPASAVFGATVDADGTVHEPVQLGTGPVQFLRAAGDATAHLVVWGRGSTSETEIVAVRVSAGGMPLDPAPVRMVADVTRYKLAGDLACGASGCLLTWLDAAVPYGPQDLLATRVAAGQSLDPAGVPLAPSAQDPLAAPVADGFTLAWADANAVRLARVGPALEIFPAGGLALLPHYDPYDPLGPAALLSATATDAWVAYEWIEPYGELRAAHWIW